MKTKLVCGVGINDSESPVQINNKVQGKLVVVWRCPFYERWSSMIKRCYDEKRLQKQTTYQGCSVCPEWLYFSIFKSWMQKQDWEGKVLDKDLLSNGSKIYSPENCVFISAHLNSFLADKISVKSAEGFTGVFKEKDGKYRASIRLDGMSKTLGRFQTALEAHKVWLKAKRSSAMKLAEEESDPRVLKAIQMRYLNP